MQMQWNRRRFLLAAGMLSPLALLMGCNHQKGQLQSKNEPQLPEIKAKTHVVQMATEGEQHFFDPDRLFIQPGDTVRWVLRFHVHTTTSYHPDYFSKPPRIPEKAQPWHSGVLTEVGQSYERRFEIEGVYNYYCTPHQSLGMVGIIVVGKPLDGPGLTPPAMMQMEGMMVEGMIYEREAEKLMELIEWAKSQAETHDNNH